MWCFFPLLVSCLRLLYLHLGSKHCDSLLRKRSGQIPRRNRRGSRSWIWATLWERWNRDPNKCMSLNVGEACGPENKEVYPREGLMDCSTPVTPDTPSQIPSSVESPLAHAPVREESPPLGEAAENKWDAELVLTMVLTVPPSPRTRRHEWWTNRLHKPACLSSPGTPCACPSKGRFGVCGSKSLLCLA